MDFPGWQTPELPVVLIVEDEPMMRTIIGQTLRGYCHVLAAADGQEALELWPTVRADVAAIITDVRMPRLDGIGLAARLRALGDLPPMLFISAFGSAFGGPGEAPGQFLPKPFRPETLLAAVGELLADVD